MKKSLYGWLTLLLCLTLFSPVLATPNTVSGISLSALEREVSRASCPLYATIETELQNYYKKTDFSDHGKQTGWYRVEDFLAWLKTNERVLAGEQIPLSGEEIERLPVCQALAAKKMSSKEPKYRRYTQALSVYLAQRYLAGHWAPSEKQIPAVVEFEEQEDGAASWRLKTIFMSGKPSFFAEDFNTGLHEAMHLLPAIIGHKQKDPGSLREIATLYAQQQYALPVKSHGTSMCCDGTRNYLNLYRQVPQCGSLLVEYTDSLLGLVLYPMLTHQNVLELAGAQKYSLSSSFLLFDLVALDRGIYYTSLTTQHEKFRSTMIDGLLKEMRQLYPALTPPAGTKLPLSGFRALEEKKGGHALMVFGVVEKLGDPLFWTFVDGFHAASLAEYVHNLRLPPVMQPRVFDFLQNLTQELAPLAVDTELPEAVLPWGEAEEILGVKEISQRERGQRMRQAIFVPAVTKALQRSGMYLPPVPEGYL